MSSPDRRPWADGNASTRDATIRVPGLFEPIYFTTGGAGGALRGSSVDGRKIGGHALAALAWSL